MNLLLEKFKPLSGKAVSCFLCESTEIKEIMVLSSLKQIVKCRSCGLIFVIPTRTLNEIECLYDDDYYRGYLLHDTKNFRERSFINHLKKLSKLSTGRKLLDVGCGPGTFLNLARIMGWDVQGIDISESAARFAKERYEISVAVGNLDDCDFQKESFDVITCWDALHEISNPDQILRKIWSLLKTGGILLLKVPTADGLLPRMIYLIHRLSFGLVKYPIKLQFQYQLYHFTPRTISILLRKVGFKILFLNRETHQKLSAISDKKWAEGNHFACFTTTVLIFLSKVLGLEEEMVIYAIKQKPSPIRDA